MSASRRWIPEGLRPNAPGAIVLVLLVALQAVVGGSSGTGQAGPGGSFVMTSSRSMGWPPSVVITHTTTERGTTLSGVEIRWLPFLVSAAVTYGLAMGIGHAVTERRRHPARILFGVVGATLVLAFLGAMLVSKSMWGYYLHRPALDRRIAEARKVLAVTFVDTAPGAEGRTLVPDRGFSIDQHIQSAERDDDDSLGERALVALKHAGRLPESPPPMSGDRLSRLYGVLARTGRLEAGEPGYDRAGDLRGVVIEAEGSDGGPIVFVGVQGGEVSNDHHPYYEFLFAGPDAAEDLKLLSAQRFYFDVAGVEGMEWPLIFAGLSALGMVVAVPTTLLLMAVWPGSAVRTSSSPPG